ncbi:ABC transporter permease [Okibacterium endophyticum]
MNLFVEAVFWILDPVHWSGPDGIPARIAEHLFYTALTVMIAAAIAISIGLFIGHTGRFRSAAILVTGALRALPTLGLLVYLAVALGFGVQFALIPTVTVLVVLAIPPLLAGAYSGVESVDSQTVDAARAVGMSEWQILVRVEVPLALPLIIGGIRSAVLQVIATATVAAYIGLGGLGRYLIDALPVRDYGKMIAGAVLVIVLALVLDGLFAIVQRFVVPRGVRGIRSDRALGSRRPANSSSLSDVYAPAGQ